jgi:cyclopropane fatty-acyl-phospholipid synthase-like methyltransferase
MAARNNVKSTDREEFDNIYLGSPPWDIGRAQKEVVRLCGDHEITGRVLDIGCGTGENSMYLASQGIAVVGVDFSANAIALARKKLAGRAFADRVNFQVADALKMEPAALDVSPFDCILDCGLFHAFEDKDQVTYVSRLGELLKPAGSYFMLCFSDKEPGTWGPRRIRREEILEAFSKGWKIISIKEAIFENNEKRSSLPEGARAWLSRIEKSD